MLPKHISIVCLDMNDSTEIGIVIGRLKRNTNVYGDILDTEIKPTLQLGAIDLWVYGEKQVGPEVVRSNIKLERPESPYISGTTSIIETRGDHIQPLNKCLLNIYYVLSPSLVAGDIIMNKKSHGNYSLVRGDKH